MLNFPYPEKSRLHQRAGTSMALPPEWCHRRTGFFRSRLSSFFMILGYLLISLLMSTMTRAQGPCPGSNCTSGDMRITKVELVDAITEGPLPGSCVPGQTNVPVKLKVTIDVTSNTRYGFLIIGDVYINGLSAGRVWQCYGTDFIQGTHTRILDQTISWPCGSTLELRDVYTAWDNQAPSTNICNYLNSDGTISNCGAIDPKCKYYGATETFTVAAPLVANFTYSGSCPGNTLYQPITFSSPSSGTGSSTGGTKPYQFAWEIRDAVTTSVLATGTGSSISYTPLTANNLTVKLTVTDASATQQTDTEIQTVTVTSCCTPPSITSNPGVQNKCEGSAASFTVGYSGGSPTPGIQWQVSSDGISWTNLSNNATYSNVTGATLNLSNVTLAMNGLQYHAVLTSGACSSVTSNAATLNVNATTVGGSVASAQTICYGNQPTSSLSLSGQTGSVQKWQKSTDNFVSNATDIANTTTTLTAAAIGALTTDTWFRAVVKNGECAAVNSSAVKITVNPTSVGGSVASAQTICYGSQPTSNLTLSGQTGTVQKWQRSTDNFVSNVSDISNTTTTLTAASIGALTTDTWFRAVVKSGECAAANSSAVKISVSPTSVGGSVGAAQTICSGSQPSSNLSLTGQTGTIVKWQRSTDNFVSNVTDISNTTTTLTAASIGALTQSTWFRAVVKSGACSEANSSAVMITVQQPVGNNTIAASQVICSGNTPAGLTGSTPSGGNGSYVYQWQIKTTGGFGDISGANGKDYAPGAITQTTEFRRNVTAGSACPNNLSSSVTISVSPESVVYPLIGSNYCATAPGTGTIKLNGSYPGVSYQLLKKSDDSPVQGPQTGTGAVITWSGLSAGEYYVVGTGIAPTYCTSVTASATVFEFDCSVFYTLTQGYYGNKNGKSCIGTTPVNTIKYLLGGQDLVTGSTNTVVVPGTDAGATKLNSVMPGGNTPGALIAGNCTITYSCFSAPDYLTKQGKINNVLLSQTITLALNTRWNGGELLLFPIQGGWLTTQKMTGCSVGATLITACSDNTVSSIQMNQNVVDYLGAGATVNELLLLANEVLGGTKVPGVNGVPSYADVASAVDCINKSFDEGRRFLDYFDTKQYCEILFPVAPADPVLVSARTEASVEGATALKELAVTAYPNPYTDKLNFVVETNLAGTASIEVYNLMGQKLSTVYQGYLTKGTHNFELNLPAQQRSHLVYSVTLAGRRVTGKVIRLNK